jgi:hypothetical protein
VCAPVASTADDLREERVAAVYAAPAAAEVASALGGALGVSAFDLERQVALDGVLAGQPDDIAVLEELADLHRGETVVVVAAGQPAQRAEVVVDADGVRVT